MPWAMVQKPFRLPRRDYGMQGTRDSHAVRANPPEADMPWAMVQKPFRLPRRDYRGCALFFGVFLLVMTRIEFGNEEESMGRLVF
jgi:hypothetical protein